MLFATPALYTVTRITRTRVVIHTRAAAEKEISLPDVQYTKYPSKNVRHIYK